MAIEFKTAELIDLSVISSFLPPLNEISIPKQNYIYTIEGMLNKNTSIVEVKGDDGIGKTSLLSQFVRENKNNSFNIFIDPSSHFAYDPEMIAYELYRQILWVLEKENFQNAISESKRKNLDTKQLLHDAIRDLRKSNHNDKYYFVIDGIDKIPDKYRHDRDLIIELLPFGVPNFFFVISGDLSFLKEKKGLSESISEFRISGFSTSEAKQFLSDVDLNDDDKKELIKLCKGNPGNLTILKRLYKNHKSKENFINTLSNEPPDWFQMEWDSIELTENLVKMLSFLAFDKRKNSISSLSGLLNINEKQVVEAAKACPVIYIDEKNNINYVNDIHRMLGRKKFSSKKTETINLIIDDLLKSPDQKSASVMLPIYYSEAGKENELLEYLSSEHIGKLIDYQESWGPLYQSTNLGVKTSYSLNRDGDLIKYSLQKSIISSIRKSEPWRSEIEAYASINDFVTPLSLADQLVINEDKLHLLAVICRNMKQKSIPIEQDIIDQIQNLYTQMDFSNLGDRGVEIASDLIYTNPEMAIDLVQSSSIGKPNADDRIDLALARLSISAMFDSHDDDEDLKRAQDMLRSKAKGSEVRDFMNSTSKFFGKYSAEELILDLKKWEKPTDKIFAMRKWIESNPKNEGALNLFHLCLDTILETTTYTPSARVYKIISLPLLYCKDKVQLLKATGRIDALNENIKEAGPTVEFVKCQSILIQANFRFDKEKSLDRIQDLYCFVEDITDVTAKLASLSVLTYTLSRIKNDAGDIGVEEIIDFLEMILEDVHKVSDEVLSKTGNHFKAVTPAIDALVRANTTSAIELINKLNTSPRRDAGFAKCIESICSDDLSSFTFSNFQLFYHKISSQVLKSKSLDILLNHIDKQNIDLNTFKSNVLSLNTLIQNEQDPELCTIFIALYLSILERIDNVSDGLIEGLFTQLKLCWENIDAAWDRINIGFKVVNLLSKNSDVKSKQFIQLIEDFRKNNILDEFDLSQIYIGNVRLLVRVFSGLIKNSHYTELDLEMISNHISRIPSLAARLFLWTDLSLKFDFHDNRKECERIVNQNIYPMLTNDEIKDPVEKWSIIRYVSPVLYITHNLSTIQLIEDIQQPYKDEAISEICSYLISGNSPFENYEHDNSAHNKVKYTTALDVCSLLEKVEVDHILYYIIELLFRHACKTKDLNNNQRADIVDKIEKIKLAKLPNSAYIKHEGYVILVDALISKFEKHDENKWKILVERANAISNHADKVYVLSKITDSIPSKYRQYKLDLLQKIKEKINDIALLEDKISLLEDLAEVSREINKPFSKECTQDAWNIVVNAQFNRKNNNTRKRLIDFAYRLDSEFANSLASETISDEGRDVARKNAKSRIDLLNLRKNFATGKNKKFGDVHDSKQLVEISQLMLTSLNSDRANAMHLNCLRDYLKQASYLGLEDSFVIFSWALENVVSRYSDTQQAKTIIRPIFDSIRETSDLTFSLISKLKTKKLQGMTFTKGKSNDIYQPGDRVRVLDRIKKWTSKAKDFIKITDPYFGMDELYLIKEIRKINPEIPIEIITSKQHQKKYEIASSIEEAYIDYWNIHILDSPPEEISVIIIGNKKGAHPIHDRWWLTKNSGLRFGTSANAIGNSRLSEISDMNADESVEKVEIINRILIDKRFGGERLAVNHFYL